MADATSLSLLEALSGISGSISLVAWMVLLLPQLLENYKNGSADALSLAFLIAWLIGDVTNLIGAIWGGLLPTVIALAFYFCIADLILVTQTIYYNHLKARRQSVLQHVNAEYGHVDATTPLIPPGPHRRGSHTCHRTSRGSHSSARPRRASMMSRRDSLSSLLRQDISRSAAALRNITALMAVCIAGTIGWTIAWKMGAWQPQPGKPVDVDMPLGAAILGYISAAFYLCARIPQIIHNARNKSCDGLSILFFALSLLGNLSYGGGILFHSVNRQYVLDNLPWLAGSVGTMFEDVIIFAQFVKYSRLPQNTSAIE